METKRNVCKINELLNTRPDEDKMEEILMCADVRAADINHHVKDLKSKTLQDWQMLMRQPQPHPKIFNFDKNFFIH